jgi:hypothetical protein
MSFAKGRRFNIRRQAVVVCSTIGKDACPHHIHSPISTRIQRLALVMLRY